MTYNNVEDVLVRLQDIVEFSNSKLTSVNQRGIFENTPLVVVAGWGDLEAARLLIDAGAELNAKAEDGDTALHRAVAFEHPDMVRLLAERGASADQSNNGGVTPRDLARDLGNAALIAVLAAH